MIGKFFLTAFCAVIFFAAQVSQVSAEEYATYQANVEGLGWLQPVRDGEVIGTTGQARRLEALIIDFRGGVQYSAHVQNIGWQKWVHSGEVAGTVGKNLRIEAIRIQPVESAKQYFDIYYRAHVQNIGWLGWAKNGEPAGTAGAALRLEALQVRIVGKDAPFDRGDKPAFYQRVIQAPMV